MGGVKPKIVNLPGSEVSEPFLRTCAGTPAAVQDMQLALQGVEDGCYKKMPYVEILDEFGLPELVC